MQKLPSCQIYDCYRFDEQQTSINAAVAGDLKIPHCTPAEKNYLSDKCAAISHFYAAWKHSAVLLCAPTGKKPDIFPSGLNHPDASVSRQSSECVYPAA